MKRIEIVKNDANQRLDRFINKLYPNMNKSLMQKYIRKKKIKVNKKKVENNYILKEGDIINIYIYDEVLDKYLDNKKEVKSRVKLDIVYEDKNILIIDKPKKLLSHAASKKDYGKNVVDFVVSYLINKGEYVPRADLTFRPAIVNRLDYNTEGLIIACKNAQALKSFNDAIENDQIEKYYRAVVHGKIDKHIFIDKGLKKIDNNMMEVSKEGKDSRTEIFPVKYSEKFSYIDIKLLTGRTHQIRTHLSSIGHPIVGDQKYGDRKYDKYLKKNNINNQLLLAYKLVFKDIKDFEYLKDKEVISNFFNDFDSLSNKFIK